MYIPSNVRRCAPICGTGLSTLVRAEVAVPSAATLFQNVRIFDGKSDVDAALPIVARKIIKAPSDAQFFSGTPPVIQPGLQRQSRSPVAYGLRHKFGAQFSLHS
jgi:hypothetical protein